MHSQLQKLEASRNEAVESLTVKNQELQQENERLEAALEEKRGEGILAQKYVESEDE